MRGGRVIREPAVLQAAGLAPIRARKPLDGIGETLKVPVTLRRRYRPGDSGMIAIRRRISTPFSCVSGIPATVAEPEVGAMRCRASARLWPSRRRSAPGTRTPRRSRSRTRRFRTRPGRRSACPARGQTAPGDPASRRNQPASPGLPSGHLACGPRVRPARAPRLAPRPGPQWGGFSFMTSLLIR